MAALLVQLIVDAGTDPTHSAATASDTAAIGSGHDTYVSYKNTDSNAKTITVVGQGTTEYGKALPSNAITLAATTGVVKIPLRKSYDDGSGSATITVTGTGGVTGVTVALVRMS